MPTTPLTSVSMTTRQRAGGAGPVAPNFVPLDQQLEMIIPLYAEELAKRQQGMAERERMIQERTAPQGLTVPPSGINTGSNIGVLLSNLGAGLVGQPQLGGAPYRALLEREQLRGEVSRGNERTQQEFAQQKQRDLEQVAGERAMLPAEEAAGRREVTTQRAMSRAEQMDRAAVDASMAEYEARLRAQYAGKEDEVSDLMAGMRFLVQDISNQLVSGQDPREKEKGGFPVLRLKTAMDPNAPEVAISNSDQLYRYLSNQIGHLPSVELQQEAWRMVSQFVIPQVSFFAKPVGGRGKKQINLRWPKSVDILKEGFEKAAGVPPRSSPAPPPR